MKITVICDVLGAENNGTTIAGMNLIRSLTERGHEVRVVYPDSNPPKKEGFYSVPVRSFGIFNGYLEKNGVCLARADKTALRAAIEGADVVHLLLPFTLSRAAVPICEQLGIPMTAGFHFQAENFTAHLGILHADWINKLIYRSRWKKVFSHVDCIHYPTAFIRRVFEQSVGVSTKGVVISNGVSREFAHNAQRYKGGSGKFTVVCTGRYSREKRQELLIKAASLCKHADDVRVILAGDGPRRDKLTRLAHRLNVDARFEFFNRDELLKTLTEADLYVHTAEVEIEAIACLEAIASGLVPVIADSPRSATKDYALSSDDLFDYKSPRALADKIDYWYENKHLMPQKREKYAGFTKEIDYEACMGRMEKMLADTVAAHARGGVR